MTRQTLERGDRLEAHSDPTTDEMVILETDHLSGYKAAFVAEQDPLTGEWTGHWLKASYIHDECNLGAASRAGTVGEERLSSLEGRLRPDESSAPTAPERVAPAPSLD